jgi:hypothetical protein
MRNAIFIASILLALASSVSAEPISPSQILTNPTAYDGKHLVVAGTVQNVIARTSRRGNDYETFDLCDNSCLKVFAWGHPGLQEGQHLSVSGTFDTVKQVGRYIFRNEIDADEGSIQ